MTASATPVPVDAATLSDMEAWRTDTAWGQGMLQARINRLLDEATDLRTRLDRIQEQVVPWVAYEDGRFDHPDDYDDPAEVFRDAAVIVLHLACGRTFPESGKSTPDKES